ncbi:hypothetical protein Afil01_13340 [Actinorhabdospora filicis]|uniref:Glycosyltransferase 2-like domain-containing protein n=1 Tax=Actinorhabdospora filicis TaxID=1785913 RepID=A0A9W6SID6_9ACTN|nr:glycosyltransferase [Actinorhabdospora filicis]GLZ76527.1 hypothetical protein Afil01_13340 [Actinorhabdospora filicis]
MPPLVSVIVPAYNSETTIGACISSALEQTIGLADVEVIAVDDGSTDGTGASLDAFAARHPDAMRVVHQENTGGPSVPRNVGLDLAQGKYVFFLDADDRLGPEALERMVGMAEEHSSDVVLGKMVGVDGRGVATTMFTRNTPRADLFRSRIYWTLSPLKLFRRDFLESLALRFPVGQHYGEDQPFTARAYLNARVISVLADYDCYYAGKGALSVNSASVATRLTSLDGMLTLLRAELPAGRRRDTLLKRHMELGLQSLWRAMRSEPDRDVRRAAFDKVRPAVAEWSRGPVAKAMGPYYRRQWLLVRAGELDAVVEQVRHFDKRGGVAPWGFDPAALPAGLRLRLRAAGPAASARRVWSAGWRRVGEKLRGA